MRAGRLTAVFLLLSLAAAVGCRPDGGEGPELEARQAERPVPDAPSPAEPEPGASSETESEAARKVRLAGEVYLRERIVLPADAELVIRLVELDDGGVATAELARTVTRSHRRQPVPFTLEVDEDTLRPGARFGLTAQVVRRGQEVFAVDSPHPVLGPDSSTVGIRLLLRRRG